MSTGNALRPHVAGRGQSAFTIIELLIVVSIIAVLTAILLPALGLARNAARDSLCRSNLRQIANVTLLIAADNDGEFAEHGNRHPYAVVQGGAHDFNDIRQTLRDYTTTTEIFYCPWVEANKDPEIAGLPENPKSFDPDKAFYRVGSVGQIYLIGYSLFAGYRPGLKNGYLYRAEVAWDMSPLGGAVNSGQGLTDQTQVGAILWSTDLEPGDVLATDIAMSLPVHYETGNMSEYNGTFDVPGTANHVVDESVPPTQNKTLGVNVATFDGAVRWNPWSSMSPQLDAADGRFNLGASGDPEKRGKRHWW